MPITQAQLAERLKAARLNSGLTQQQVAETLGLSRTSVVQMEAGTRAISSLELVEMARLYGRGLEELVQETGFTEDPVTALFRAVPEITENQTLINELRHCISLCRAATRLERMVGWDVAPAFPATYRLDPPRDRWEAVKQGRTVAVQERGRLNLGSSPAVELPGIMWRQGVRVTEYDMPDNISGLFFQSKETGMTIVVNRRHHRNRRLFSYAHEYGHLLVDRDQTSNISRSNDRDQLAEIRANAFAAHFLMPEEGVRSFLQSLGKGEETRQVQEIHDGVGEVQVQKRMPPGSQELQAQDVTLLSHHFGVSYEAALYHLLNLKLLLKDRFKVLLEQQDLAAHLARVLRLPIMMRVSTGH